MKEGESTMIRVKDKQSKTRKLLIGASLSLKDITEILESHERELDALIERVQFLEKGSQVTQ
jgi:hypothetical protein